MPKDLAANTVLQINSATLGMNYRIARQHNTDLVLGAQVTGRFTYVCRPA